MHFDENNHEEVDTLMICLAASAAQRCPQARMVLFSPDTDVLVLAIANYRKLCRSTAISMTSCTLEIEPIWRVLGPDKAAALPAFHAFTGADNVGRFSGIGKVKWFQQYMNADNDIISAFIHLTDNNGITEEIRNALAKFVCLMYRPKGIDITNIPELRWHLFCKHLAESNKLPPTVGALEEHIKRARVQSTVWFQATTMWQCFLDPLQNGYTENENGGIQSLTTKVPPAPDAIIELVRCRCKTKCISQLCSCRKHKLPCTELCSCGSECENDADCIAEKDTEENDNEQ